MNKVTGKQLKDWADWLKKEQCGCCHLWLVQDDNRNDWAIVMGWQDGFDEKENGFYQQGTWNICIKVAYQSHNSIMQCDYDIDWLMPVCNEFGDVDGAELSIEAGVNWDKLADYLNKEAERIVKSFAYFEVEEEECA